MKITLMLMSFMSIFSPNNAYAFDPNDLKKLKETGTCVGCDLSGADLTGADLQGAINLMQADLTGADLRGVMLIGANLTEADLRGANLSAKTYMRKAQLVRHLHERCGPL